jgi:serine protease Do
MPRRIILSIIILVSFGYTQNTIVKQFSQAMADVAEKVNPAVVTILTEKVYRLDDIHEGFPFNFFPRNMPEQEYHGTALGSGVVVDAENGYILTNNHVISDAEEIQIELIDKRVFPAVVIGADPKSDIAVLQVEAQQLTALELGNSDDIRVGEWVMAVGSPFSANLSHSVTAGIISALGRSNIIAGDYYEDFIQTDAAINPGNSGGALLNLEGDLIGINTAIATGGYEKANRGVGFAIPSNMAKKVMNDLLTKGYVVRSWLGVYIQEVEDRVARALDLKSRDGALVTNVVEDSPAEKAGIEEGDVILNFNGINVEDPSHLKNIVSATEPGLRSKIQIVRDGKVRTLHVIVEEREDETPQLASGSGRANDLGLVVEDITRSNAERYDLGEISEGVVVIRSDRRGAAYRAGIRPGDVITRVGTKKVNSRRDFHNLIETAKVDDSILLLVRRAEGSRFFALDIGD